MLRKPMTYENALQRCAGLCAAAEQSAASLRLKMQRWNVLPNDIDKVIEYLYDHNFLNGSRYAAAYTRDKIRFNGWGKRKVSLMLRQEGIDPHTISEALLQIDEQEYRDVALRVMRQKARGLDLSVYEQRMKLARSMVSRGFEQDLIFDLIDLCASPQ